MVGDLNSLERRVSDLTVRLRQSIQQVQSAEANLRDIDEAIATCYRQICSLKDERRGRRGSDREAYTAMIDDEYVLKSKLHGQRSEAKATLDKAVVERKRTRSEAASELRELVDNVQRHVGNLQRLGNTLLPAEAFGAGTTMQTVNLHAAQRLQQQVSTLRNELSADGYGAEETVDLTYVPMPDFKAWADAVPLPDGTPSLIRPIDGGRSYYEIGGGRQIPVDDYDVTDTIRPQGTSSQARELFGVAYALEYLRTQGHVLVKAIGGPSAPDILSVGIGRSGRLVVTEAKGTTSGTRLDQTNLTTTLADGGKRHENERSYLRRISNTVLIRMGHEIEACTDFQRRQELMAMRSELGRVSRRGFIPGEYETQVIQVGWGDPADPKAKELRPATLIDGSRLREYLDAVQPDRIVQINVLAGSEQARIADSGPPTVARSGSAGSIASSAGTLGGGDGGDRVSPPLGGSEGAGPVGTCSKDP